MQCDKNGVEIIKIMFDRLQLFDSAKFIVKSCQNLSERIHEIKYKFGHDDKKCKFCNIRYKCCSCFLEYTNIKDDLIGYNCLSCNKIYKQKFDEKLKKRYFTIYRFSNHDNCCGCLYRVKMSG